MTDAGKRLLAEIERLDYDAYDAAREAFGDWPQAVAAIEAEAVAAERARIRAAVERLSRFIIPTGDYIDLDETRAIMDGADERQPLTFDAPAPTATAMTDDARRRAEERRLALDEGAADA